jgi:hypothetical protein
MEFKDWIKEAAGEMSARSGKLVGPAELTTEESRQAHSNGLTVDQFVAMLEKRPTPVVIPTLRDTRESFKFPAASLGFSAVFGIAILYFCGGCFGVPYTLFYRSPEWVAEQKRQSDEELARKTLTDGEIITIKDPMLFATDNATFDQVLSSTKSGDKVGLSELRSKSAYTEISKGARLRVLEDDVWGGHVKVRVESGPRSGEAGIVSRGLLLTYK